VHKRGNTHKEVKAKEGVKETGEEAEKKEGYSGSSFQEKFSMESNTQEIVNGVESHSAEAAGEGWMEWGQEMAVKPTSEEEEDEDEEEEEEDVMSSVRSEGTQEEGRGEEKMYSSDFETSPPADISRKAPESTVAGTLTKKQRISRLSAKQSSAGRGGRLNRWDSAWKALLSGDTHNTYTHVHARTRARAQTGRALHII